MSEKRSRRTFCGLFAAIAGVGLSSVSSANAGEGRVAPADIDVSDVNNHKVRPLADKNRKATLLIFIAHDCPISNAYAPEVGRICSRYAKRGLTSYIVYVERDIKPKDARNHAAEFSYPCPALLDPKRKLIKYAGARMTPEAALMTPGGKVIYLGRIDDTYIDFGKRRDAPTTHDLRNAIEALLSHKTVSPSKTKVIGCYIPDVP